VNFDGLLFACIPCTDDKVTVVLVRPDNTSVFMVLQLSPIGGPYPGGLYNGTFKPDVVGPWQVRAVWEGNEAMLPAYSPVAELEVRGSDAVTGADFSPVAVAGVVGLALVLLAAIALRRRSG
jgi:hypothetical protein